MTLEVYKHLLKTYYSNIGIWIGWVFEVIRTLMARIWITVIMADIAAFIVAEDLDSATYAVWLFLIVSVVAAIIGTIGNLIVTKKENATYRDLSIAFYKKLTSKDMAFYRDHQTGYLATLFRQYLDGLMGFNRFMRTSVTRVVISLSAPIIVLFFADKRVGLIALLVVLVQVMYVQWSSHRVQESRLRSREVYRKLTAEVSDEITNVVAFKASGNEKDAYGNVQKLATEEAQLFKTRFNTITWLDLPRSIITAAGVAVAFYFVVLDSTGTPETVALIVLTITYMFQIIRNVSEIPDLIVRQDDYISQIQPTLKYLSDRAETITDPKNPKSLIIDQGAIDIEDVTFSYSSNSNDNKDILVFDKLTINIKGGEHVGIVGLSGAGKSTLAGLLMRFDDIDEGVIKIDGIDIREIKQVDLRKKIAYVPQEPLLFHKSIRENIAYYNKEATDKDIIQAAQASHAHEFIDSLPNKYDTIVGERGVKLSGGQKQRVVIARAVLKNAPIMIFDEATSALDSESEKIIQQALPQVINKHTAVIIAHRLSTVAGLDRIIIMHEGKIIEEGTHEELLALKGRYYTLWQKQISNGQE